MLRPQIKKLGMFCELVLGASTANLAIPNLVTAAHEDLFSRAQRHAEMLGT
jgi:hypothetical protein